MRRESGITVAAANGSCGVRDRLRRKARRRRGFGNPAKARLRNNVYRRGSLLMNRGLRGGRWRRHRFGSGAGFASIAATTTATAARTTFRRVGGGSSSTFRSGSGNLFNGPSGLMLKGQGRFKRLKSRRGNRKIVEGNRRLRGRLPAEAYGSFLGLGFPIGAAKTLRRGGVPLGRFAALPSGLKEFSKLESDHGVACFLIKVGELAGGVFSGASAADASGNLFPVGHTVRAL